jgi:hypothetical protein
MAFAFAGMSRQLLAANKKLSSGQPEIQMYVVSFKVASL